MPPSTARRTVLLTGASGVVGSALAPRLARSAEVICLTHSTPVAGHGLESVRGDLTEPLLGLAPARHAALARRVDAIVHAGAVTDFQRPDGSLEATNVDGTARIVELAAAAGAKLYHVSTAFVGTSSARESSQAALAYAASKRAAERLVRDSGVPATILRPSIVIGASGSGEVARFQGIYGAAGAVLRGLAPIVPFEPEWHVDVIPQDVVADAVGALVDDGAAGGELWLTAGPAALTIRDTLETVLAVGQELGVPVATPRFVPPEVFDRLIAPVFVPSLPRRMRTTVLRLLDLFGSYMALERPFPTSMPALRERYGLAPPPDSRDALTASLRYWARATGLGADAEQVA